MTDAHHPKPGTLLLPTLIAALVLGAVLSMKMMASGLALVVIFLAFWLPYSLLVMIRKPERRRVQGYKIGIWVLMIVAVTGIHLARRTYAREYADSIVQKIEQFREKQGRFPDNLDEIGMSPSGVNARLGLFHYSNRPLLNYPDTMMIFHSWSYDFGRREWVYEGD